MKSQAIKLELLEWLATTNDEGVLKALMFFKKSADQPDWFDTLTPEQLSRVEEGIADYKKGRTVKSKDVWAKYGKKG
jgi:hypothetical protein